MSYIGSELRFLRRENVRLNRKLALQRMPGKVAQRDDAARKVRLELGEDPESGEKILGPWIRVQSTSAGKFKGFVMPAIGEQMYQESPSGIVGADSLATFGAFDDENKHPSQEADQFVFENGDTRLSLKAGEVALASGGSTLTVGNGEIRLKAGKIVTEGETHLGGDGGKAAAQQGTVDTGGFQDVGNLATKVFVT